MKTSDMPPIAFYTIAILSGLSFIAGVVLLRVAAGEEPFEHPRITRGVRWFAASAFILSLYFAGILLL